MPIRTAFTPLHLSGHAPVDAQHAALIAQCNALADACEADQPERFDTAFAQLKQLVREHFETESALLAEHGCDDLDDHRFEFDEFDYIAGQVATTQNFDRLEVQRFLALWCIGHVSQAHLPDTAPA